MANLSALTSTIDNEQRGNICDSYSNAYIIDIVDIITISFNLVFSVPAIVGNLLVLLAIQQTTSMGLPSRTLLGSLAFADLSVGLFVQPFFALSKLVKQSLVRCIVGLVYDFSSGHLSVTSLLTMVLISLDKFMALQLKFRYRVVVTFKRTMFIVGIIWTIAIPWSLCYFLYPRVYFYLVLLIIPLSFLVSSFVFIRIYIILRRQQCRLRARTRTHSTASSQENALNMSLYRRSVTTTLYVYCALLVAYLPVWVALVVRTFYGKTTNDLKNATELGLLFVLINSTVNPGLYLWRITDLRMAALAVLGRFKMARHVQKIADHAGSEIEVPTPIENFKRDSQKDLVSAEFESLESIPQEIYITRL